MGKLCISASCMSPSLPPSSRVVLLVGKFMCRGMDMVRFWGWFTFGLSLGSESGSGSGGSDLVYFLLRGSRMQNILLVWICHAMPSGKATTSSGG